MGDCSDWARAPQPVRGYVSPPPSRCRSCFAELEDECAECSAPPADPTGALILVAFAVGWLLGLAMGAGWGMP